MTTTATDAVAVPAIEEWLDARGIPWTLDVVDLAAVDRPAGLDNQTRLEALNTDALARYTADMADGATFPAVVLRLVDGRWAPVDGNHRLTSAADAGRRQLHAYLLKDVTGQQAHELSIAANRTHGLPLTDEERLWHAVQMVKEQTATIEAAAAACGIPKNRLQARLGADRFAQRCAKSGITGWGDLSTTTRSRLDTIDDSRVFRRMVELAGARVLQHRELDDTISRVNQMPSAQALEHVDGIRKDNAGRTRNRRGHPVSATTSPRRRLLSDLDILIARFTPADVARDCTTNEARQQVSQQIKAAVRHLIKIEQTVTGTNHATGRR